MIETVAETASTNSAQLARLGQGEAIGEGTWLIADRQTAGRGRAGRAWSDGHGNFMGSTVAQLRAGDPPAPTLSLVAGVALHRAICAAAHFFPPPLQGGRGWGLSAAFHVARTSASGERPHPNPSPEGEGLDGLQLKWPNDVLVDGAKLAGILLERHDSTVVVGMGVNLAQAPELPDRPTVSLAALGCNITRDDFANMLAEQWHAALAQWHDHGWPSLREEWLSRAHPRGTLLQVHDSDAGMIIGAFAGLDRDGAALLRLADGEQRAIHAGDMELVRD
ncbi:biotin--[acetyl-CoA-carboxylase] ligase [Novosphingobium sp.]|uniref:biotin--[acetyl-CoA-carboxylase] ligase n=1 Tax=Novosphingobium sp. TaxID=1874826 RepID=UPI003B52D2CF